MYEMRLKGIILKNVYDYYIQQEDNYSAFMKILVNHSQILFMFDNFSNFVTDIIDIFLNNIANPSESMINIQNEKEIKMQEFYMQHYLCLIQIAVACIISCIIFKFKRLSMLYAITSTIGVSILLIQPGLTLNALQFLSQLNLYDVWYSSRDLLLTNDSAEYQEIFTFSIISLTLWIVISILFLQASIYYWKKQGSDGKIVQIIFGNLFSDYCDRGYAWDIVNFLYKMALIIPITLEQGQSTSLYGIEVLIIINHAIIQQKIQPYQKIFINLLAFLSDFVLILTLVTVISIKYSENTLTNSQQYAIQALLLINLLFLGLVFYQVLICLLGKTKVLLIQLFGNKLKYKFLNTSKSLQLNSLWRVVRNSAKVINLQEYLFYQIIIKYNRDQKQQSNLDLFNYTKAQLEQQMIERNQKQINISMQKMHSGVTYKRLQQNEDEIPDSPLSNQRLKDLKTQEKYLKIKNNDNTLPFLENKEQDQQNL